MNLKQTVILSGFAIVMIAATSRIAFAEETTVAPIDQTVVTTNQQPALGKETDMQWAWGEVTNLDNQAKTINLKCLDYETDQEKELVLVVDEKTTFENIKDFNELKLKDTLSIDYIVGVDNKNIAKNISFEKPDVSSVPALSETTAPAVDLAQPTAPQSEIPVDPSIVVNEAPVPVESASTPAAPESVGAVQNQAQ